MPIKSYTIEKRDAMKSTWLNAGRVDRDTLTFTASHLTEGNDYYFRVSAENKIGVGEPTELSKAVTAKLPYGTSTNYCFITVSYVQAVIGYHHGFMIIAFVDMGDRGTHSVSLLRALTSCFSVTIINSLSLNPELPFFLCEIKTLPCVDVF